MSAQNGTDFNGASSALREETLKSMGSDGAADKLEVRSNTTAADSVETSSVGSESFAKEDSQDHPTEDGQEGTSSMSVAQGSTADGQFDAQEEDCSDADSTLEGNAPAKEDGKVFVPVPLERRTPQWCVGAINHDKGECNPCVWFWKARGCSNEEACDFCHTCPPGMVKQRKQEKIRRLKMERREQRARMMKAQSNEWRNAMATARTSMPVQQQQEQQHQQQQHKQQQQQQQRSRPARAAPHGLPTGADFNKAALLANGHAGMMAPIASNGQLLMAHANNMQPMSVPPGFAAWNSNASGGSNMLSQEQHGNLVRRQQQMQAAPMGRSQQPAGIHPDAPAYVNVQAPSSEASLRFLGGAGTTTASEAWLSQGQSPFEASTQKVASSMRPRQQNPADVLDAARHVEATCAAVQQALADQGVSLPKEEVLELLARRHARMEQANAAAAQGPSGSAWQSHHSQELSRSSHRGSKPVACPAPGLPLPSSLVLSL